MDQGQQSFWLGPKGPTELKGYSLQQELEKAGEAGFFSNLY